MPRVYIKRGPRANTWTAEQKQLLEQLRIAGVAWPEVATRCGHPESSCKTTLSLIRTARRKAGLAVQTGPGDRKSFTRYVPPAPAPAPSLPPEPAAPPSGRTRHTSTLIADAELRARIEILGPTGGLFGDPLPGRSALDQKRGEASR